MESMRGNIANVNYNLVQLKQNDLCQTVTGVADPTPVFQSFLGCSGMTENFVSSSLPMAISVRIPLSA